MSTYLIEYKKLGINKIEIEFVRARSVILAIKDLQKKSNRQIKVIKITTYKN